MMQQINGSSIAKLLNVLMLMQGNLTGCSSDILYFGFIMDQCVLVIKAIFYSLFHFEWKLYCLNQFEISRNPI